MKNRRLRIHGSLNRAEDNGPLRSLGNCHLFLLLVWSWGNMRAMEYRAVHDVIMCPSHHLRCSGEQELCAVHQPDAVTLNSQKTVKSSWEPWAETQGQPSLLESCSQSHVSQSSHPRVFFLVYSNQGKQTWSSSLRGIWQHPRRSNEVSGSRYSSEMWTGPYINTRTLAIPQEGSFIDLPRLFCSKLIKGHTA